MRVRVRDGGVGGVEKRVAKGLVKWGHIAESCTSTATFQTH